jgi:hypothetical protein
VAGIAVLGCPLVFAAFTAGQTGGATALPFASGERLDYVVTLSNGSKVGTAGMWVEGPTDVRGSKTLLLRFDSRIRYMLVPGRSTSSSWFDPARGASLRFTKRERNPLSRHDEAFDLFPEERRWKSEAGDSGSIPTAAPLDELSFMYFIRTLELTPGAVYSFDRYFDAARNPTVVRVLRREVIPTPVGELHVVRVEMRVRDPQHYAGEGIIRIHLSDDACRIPVRIESTMPVIGTAVLTITAAQSPCRLH